MSKPCKPHADFPLGAWPNGQWGKKVRGKPYYFGSWKDDPQGTHAAGEYAARLPGILAGTDHLRRLEGTAAGYTAGGLSKLYLDQRSVDVDAGTLAKATYIDYSLEITNFTNWVKASTPVASLRPEHFAAYVNHLIQDRGLKSRARRRVTAIIKGMFRWGAGNGHGELPNFGTAFKAPSTTPAAVRREKLRAGIKDHSTRIVTGAEIDGLIAACKGKPNFEAMILLMVNCGLGPAEIGRLKWSNIVLGGRLVYPRQKTGNERLGYIWKRTHAALERLKDLKHTKAAIARDGKEALVFITRKGLPYYREEIVVVDGADKLKRCNAISVTVGRMVRTLGYEGVTPYRLRHTFKTLGKKAKDRDALNLCMGHKTNSVEEGYDHETIEWKRIRRIALVVKKRLWPKAKQDVDASTPPVLKIVGGEPADPARLRSA